jgi:hypothetical protein
MGKACYSQFENFNFSLTDNWPTSNLPSYAVAHSLEEALRRPSTIRELFVWKVDSTLAKQIPKLKNLEKLTFGYYDMDYECPAFKFPVEFCFLPKLREINIINAIDPMPQEFDQMKSLRILNCYEKLPPSISLLDSLEEFSGRLPDLPWPGNFKGLKKVRGANMEQLEKLTSLEEMNWDLPYEFLPKFKKLKKLNLEIDSTTSLATIFKYLDQLPDLEELNLDCHFIRKNTESASPDYFSSTLAHIKKLMLNTYLDLSEVLPEHFDSLENLSLEFPSWYYKFDPPRSATKIQVSSMSPESLISKIGALRSLTIYVNENEDENYISEKWLTEFANDKKQIEIDSLQILNSNGAYYSDQGQPLDAPSVIPHYSVAIVKLIGQQKHLKSIKVLGLTFPELNSLTNAISKQDQLSSLDLYLITIDGNPFPMDRLSVVQKHNFTLLSDDFTNYDIFNPTDTIYPGNREFYDNNPWRKKAKCWKLVSKDIPYSNYSEDVNQRYYDRPNPYHPNYLESSRIILDTLPDSLPIVTYIFSKEIEGSHPEILWSNKYYCPTCGLDNYGYCCPLCVYGAPELLYYDDGFNIKWESNVREDSSFHISTRQFKKGFLENHGDGSRIEWYPSGALKKYALNDVIEFHWSETGKLLYTKWEDKSLTEIQWDENGNILWAHLRNEVNPNIAEINFYPDQHVKSEGWVIDGKPTGKWYYFDTNGNVTSGNPPKRIQ